VHGYSLLAVGRFEERAPGADEFDLRVRDASGTRTLVDVGVLRAQNGGAAYAINYLLPAPDGSKVAVGISAGGSKTHRCSFTTLRPARRSRDRSTVPSSARRRGARMPKRCTSSV
jgi:hypothetical protein